MNTLKNSVHLIGHLGADPEIKVFDNGKKMVRISLATNSTYKDAKGEKVEETSWHNLIAWNLKAENMTKLLLKGDEIAIEGKLSSRSYEDKEGVKKYITEVVVNEFLKFGKRAAN